MKLSFGLQINTKVFYKMVVISQTGPKHEKQSVYNIFAISQGKHEDEVDFLPADKC